MALVWACVVNAQTTTQKHEVQSGETLYSIARQYNITVAAPTIGDSSKEAILGTEGLETLKETILNHAITRKGRFCCY